MQKYFGKKVQSVKNSHTFLKWVKNAKKKFLSRVPTNRPTGPAKNLAACFFWENDHFTN